MLWKIPAGFFNFFTFIFKSMRSTVVPNTDDLTVFYEQGDTAPLGRFRFRYLEK